MNIPQVNAGATARNREQTKRICELAEGNYKYMKNRFGEPVADSLEHKRIVYLPNGSLILDQVVGMLKEYGVYWDDWGEAAGWTTRDGDVYLGTELPHDLTAAMDALIKVLEEKK